MQEALIAYLLAYSALTALVGQRINWTVTPQASADPRVVLTVVSDVPEYADDGEAGLAETRVQVDVYAATYKAATDIARLVFARLSAVSDTIGGVDFQDIEMVNSSSSFETPPDGVNLYRVRQDYMIWHNA